MRESAKARPREVNKFNLQTLFHKLSYLFNILWVVGEIRRLPASAMLPWEHLALGYVSYSAYSHWRRRAPPEGRAALAVAVGTQVPDLIDKPLAWAFELLPSGHSLGHSLLFALPLVLLVGAVAHRTGRARVGPAFATGYLSHLPADLASPLMVGEPVYLGYLVWPFGSWPLGVSGLGDIVAVKLTVFLSFYATPAGRRLLLAEAVAMALVLALWLRDGKPGATEARTLLGRLASHR